jgi:hypothetical protein
MNSLGGDDMQKFGESQTGALVGGRTSGINDSDEASPLSFSDESNKPEASDRLRVGDQERMTTKPSPNEEAFVKYWLARIKSAQAKMQSDFDRMHDNQRFAKGLQWAGQNTLDSDKYVCNLVLQAINRGVAALYARDPKVDYHRRERMDFAIWDERIETLQMVQQDLAMNGPNANPMSQAIIADYQQGRQWKDTVDRIGKIIKIVVQYMFDTQQPSFKLQMKQLVRRVKTNYVGYLRIKYQDSFEPSMTTSETQSTIVARLRTIAHLVKKYESDKLTDNAKEFETLQALALSIGQSITSGDTQNILEQIAFDFPPSDSIIVDSRCRQLKGFVDARWIAQRYCPSLDYVNELFELTGGERELTATSVTKLYNKHGDEYKQADSDANSNSKDDEEECKPHCLMFEVFDLDTKSTFFLVDGCKWLIQPPEAVEPETNSFWPIKVLTFNDIECDPQAYEGGDSTLFGPSDVDLLRSTQREYNRTREAWRWQRIANSPKYMTGRNWLTDNDKDAINNAEDNSIVELEGAPIGSDIGKMLAPFRYAPFDQPMYDTSPLMQDLLQSTGMLQENLGPVSAKGTATGQTIAEQSRVSGLSSNVDDIDMLLCETARDCGEIVLRRFRKPTVVRIAGRGAMLAWPDDPKVKEDFINELFLDTVAASSGRPNKALETANFERIAPILINAGANPIGIVEWGKQVMDVDVELDRFFPIIPPPMGGAPTQGPAPSRPGSQNQRQQQRPQRPQQPQRGQQRPAARPQQPLQQLKSQNPVGLAAS